MGFINFDGSGTEIDFDIIGKFAQVTEWKEDAWNRKERGHVENTVNYLDCAKIMHGKERVIDIKAKCVSLLIHLLNIHTYIFLV